MGVGAACSRSLPVLPLFIFQLQMGRGRMENTNMQLLLGVQPRPSSLHRAQLLSAPHPGS